MRKTMAPMLGLMLLVVFGSGCMTTMRSPLVGFVYTGVQTGEDVGGNGAGTKRGEACATSILGIVATGDASIETAARQAGIGEVTHIDSSQTNILGIYGEHCTIAYGK